MKNRYITLLAVAVIAALALPLLFLKGCGSSWDGSNTIPVTIRLGSAVPGDEPVPLPPGVRFVEISITAADMSPLHRVLDTGGIGPVSEAFNVPPGADRLFKVTAKDLRDETGTAIWNGSKTEDIGTEPVHVAIEMSFVLASDVLPPDTPTGLSASSPEPGKLFVSWNESSDNNTVAGYYVYALVENEYFLINSTTEATLTETGLMAGEYCLSVSVMDPSGNESDLATEICIEVTGESDELPPGAPAALNATAVSATGISITWQPPADVEAPAGYNIYNSGGVSGRFVSSSTGLVLTDTRLEEGTYCYNATSVDTWHNESGFAGPACASITGVLDGPPGDTEDPTTPEGLVANAVPMTGITLVWGNAADNNTVAGYNIYEDTGLGFKFRTSSISNTLDLERLAPAYYCFAVSAVDATGNESALSARDCALLSGNAYGPRVPDCPEFLTYYDNPGGNYKWHPDSNPPKCYGALEAPRTWWKKPPPGLAN